MSLEGGIWPRISPSGDPPLQRLYDATDIGIVIASLDGRIIEANQAFLQIIGYTRFDLDQGLVDWRNLTPQEWLSRDEEAIAELARCGLVEQYEKEYTCKDGSRVSVLVGGALLEEGSDEVISFVLDLTEQKRSQAKLQESELQYRILAEALPQVVMLSDKNRRLSYVNKHYEEYTGVATDELPFRWREVIHPDDLHIIDHLRETSETYEVEYRLRRATDGMYRWHFARCIELPCSPSGGGGWLAIAMDIDDRKRAQDSLRFMEKASLRLSESLDLQTTLETMLELVLPDFGDWASINLRGNNQTIKTVIVRHKDESKAHLAQRLCNTWYLKDTHSWGTAEVFRTGRPYIRSGIRRDELQGSIKDTYFSTVEAMGYGTLIVVPIHSREQVIGSLAIATAGDKRIYTQADLTPLEELARRAGFAIGNASQYEREYRVASLLQKAALPNMLPSVPGFSFHGYYQAGREEALIGGDWYDAMVLADGRIVVVVGDVAGSGIHAAIIMSNMRQLIRGAAYVCADPLIMLDVADQALRSEYEDVSVTAFVGVIDPIAHTITYASAGHVPALLRMADGKVCELQASGLPLGCRDMAENDSKTSLLPFGSELLLYTDGLVEWSRDIIAGGHALQQYFAKANGDRSANPARALVESLLAPGAAVDDVAVMMIHVNDA